MAVDAVAFDFAGVVIRTPFEMAAGLEDRLDLPRGSIDLAGPFDPDADPSGGGSGPGSSPNSNTGIARPTATPR